MDKKKEGKWERFTYLRVVALVVGGIVLCWIFLNMDAAAQALRFVWQLVYPFFLGTIMAFLLNLPMSFIERTLFGGRGGRLRRPVSLLLAAVVVLLIIFAVLNMLLPSTLDAAGQLISRLPRYLDQAEEALAPYLEVYAPSVQTWLEDNDDLLTGLLAELAQYLQGIDGNLFASTMNVATSFLGQFIRMLVALVLMCHLLLRKERLLAQADGLLLAWLPPKPYARVRQVATLTYRSYAGFAAGLCLEAVMEGVLFFLILTIGGFDHALLIGIIMGFAALIPILGAWGGAIFGALLLLVSMGPVRMLVFILITLIVQQIGSNVLIPKVIGESIGLPTIWTLVAVILGSGLGGVFGILFFIPLFSVIYTLTRQKTLSTLESKGIESPVAKLAGPQKEKKRKKKDGAQ